MAYTFKHGDRPVEGYTIQRAVGKGGFGEVYYSVSDGGREVAIKYLRDNPHIELRGVSHCMNLKSPHLVSIFDVKKTVDDEYAIIMEYCSGPSLRDLLIAEPNGFEPQKAAFFVREIAKGLAYLHDRGIVHRDLKPGNIFYDDGYVKIGDYGLSKFISISRHSGQTASVGTVHYMAPEIGSGNYSRGVDIYALGVMLYEMLLGQVPFEGSSMAEVLMKHLTTQPEVDHLPKPFAQVIRKALQKDPNDRYQDVNEMIDDLLDVEEVRESLAGFSLKSLEGAVHGGAPARADSPMPSPNPIRGYAADFDNAAAAAPARPPYAQPIGNPADLPARLGKRMERISNKIDAKVAKLSGKRAPRKKRFRRSDQKAPAGPAPARSERRKRILLTGILSAGLAIALGVLVGTNMGVEEAGAAAGMLTVALSGGLMLSRRAGNWFGVAQGPNWAQMLVRLVCCGPLLAAGTAPLLDSKYQDEGGAILLGLLALAVFGCWYKDDDTQAPGEIRFGTAIWKALSALIFTAIAGSMLDARRTEDFIFVAAGVAGVVSLITQAAVWCSLPRRELSYTQDGSPQSPGGEPPPRPGHDQAERIDGAVFHMADSVTRTEDAGLTQEGTFGGSARHSTHGTDTRWGITRAFWGLISFLLMGGAIMGFLIPLVTSNLHYHDITAWIIGCTGFASFMLFALRKTTPIKRETFWLETLRPFLIALSMFGIGAAIVGISREWGHQSTCNGEQMYSCVPDEGAAGIITGLVMASILLLFLVFFTGRKRGPSQPFVMAGSGHGEAAGPATPPVATPSDFDSGARSMSAYAPAPPIAVPTAPSAGATSAIALMPHRGILILVLGIVGISLFPFGIAAWVMGHHDMSEMDGGRMDPGGRGLTLAGKVCGMIGSLFAMLGTLMGVTVAFAAIFGAF